MRKAGESEDEFVVNEADDMNDDGEKDSDSGNNILYLPQNYKIYYIQINRGSIEEKVFLK